jgi:hypothetical protein
VRLIKNEQEIKKVKNELKCELDCIEEYMQGQEIGVIMGNADILAHM